MVSVSEGLAVDRPRAGIFLLIKSTPTPIRLWAGVGPFDLPADTIDTTGGRYQGFGAVTGIPALNALINGQAQRVEFSLSGAPRPGISEMMRTVIALALADAASVRFARVHVGIISFGADWQPRGPIEWRWEGEADTPKASRTGSGGQASRVVSLSVGTAFTGRRRPKLGFYTGVDQRRRSPTDAFCDLANRYSSDSTVVWPR